MASRSSASWLGSLVTSWDRFLFAPGDPTTLGLIRICAGILILYSTITHTLDLQQFFGKDAWLSLSTLNYDRINGLVAPPPTKWEAFVEPLQPRDAVEYEAVRRYGITPSQAIDTGLWQWSAWFHITEPRAMLAVHIAAIGCILLFTVGLATRVTGVLTWIAMLSYINRAPNALFGMDTIMIVAMLYLMIGPAGSALSLDRWLGLRLASRRLGENVATWDTFLAPAPSISANFAIRLIQIHTCFIYGASGISKLLGNNWWTGTAVWGTMANYEFSPMGYRWYMSFLQALATNRPVWEIVLTMLTFGTLIFEVGFPFLVWSSRWRWTMVAAAVGLHMGIAFFMGLVTFSMMMLTIVLSFVPPELVRGMFQRIGFGRTGAAPLAQAA